MKEIWKDIPRYEGFYQVSSIGRVKSLARKWRIYEHILKPCINKRYLTVALSINNKIKSFEVHQLIAMAFLGHEPNGYNIVVDHINNNPLDNRVENIQLISSRENTSKDRKNKTSKYTGVSLEAGRKMFKARIRIDKSKTFYLGIFKTEKEASLFYKKALENKHLYDGDNKKFRNLIKELI